MVYRARGLRRHQPTNPSTGIRRFATGSTARKRLSSATAPTSAGPAGAMTQGVVTSALLRDRLPSATGHSARWPPAISTGWERLTTSSSRSASDRGTTSSVAPVSTRRSASSLRPVGPVRRPLTRNNPIDPTLRRALRTSQVSKIRYGEEQACRRPVTPKSQYWPLCSGESRGSVAPEPGAQEEEAEHHDHAGGRIDGRQAWPGERHEVAHAERADGCAAGEAELEDGQHAGAVALRRFELGDGASLGQRHASAHAPDETEQREDPERPRRRHRGTSGTRVSRRRERWSCSVSAPDARGRSEPGEPADEAGREHERD